MNKTNPIFEALNELNENYAAEAILPRKKKMKKPLKIALIVVAATLALGTTAIAASSGDRPVMKLNHKEMIADYDEYVNADGWTVKTLTALEPYDEIVPYRPVGRIRAYYENGDFTFYDELGVNINRIAADTDLFGTAFKGDESDLHAKFADGPDYLRGRGGIAGDYSSMEFEEWIDPIKYAEYQVMLAKFNRMSIQEKVYYLNLNGYDYYDGFNGISHPTAEEHFTLDGNAHTSMNGFDDFCAFSYQSTPSEVYKIFGFTPIIGADMTEDTARCFALLNYNNDNKEFTQGLYQYSLTDMASGTPIDFTAWHYADLKDTFTDHYGFDYEYIELNDGTQARLHRSITGDYIAEFEHEGSAYAFKTSLDRDNVTRILANLGVFNA